MASKFRTQKRESNKKKVYSLILIFLMVSSVLAFVFIYGGDSNSSSSSSYNGFSLYVPQNGYSIIIPEINFEIYNHPTSLGLDTFLSKGEKEDILFLLKNANTIGVTSSFNTTDSEFIDTFKFNFDTRTDIFDSQIMQSGFYDTPINAIDCSSEFDLVIKMVSNNLTSDITFEDNCLTLNYFNINDANQMYETIFLSRAGVLE